jgi:hypothetical protein
VGGRAIAAATLGAKLRGADASELEITLLVPQVQTPRALRGFFHGFPN